MSRWKLNDGSGTTAWDSAGVSNATATGGVTWSTERGGSAVFNGTNAAFTTNGKVFDTTRSFSVSAWVKTRSLDTAQTAVSQEGSTTSAFLLQYSPTARRWVFTLHGSDTANPPVVRLQAGEEATLDWTHLTATYDAESMTARLYVNGLLQGWTSPAVPFGSTGKLTIGRARSGGSSTEWFNGMVSDVRVHQRTLSSSDALLSAQQPNFAPFPHTGVLVGPDFKTDVERSVLSAPDARTALVALGSTEILRGVPADQVRGMLTDMINTRTGLKKHLRKDGSALHVVLTTIPSLGLDPGDLREQQRRQLNADMMTNYRNYNADHVVDFDAAVRDSSDASKVAPQYLTSGVPNDAYHQRLAEYLAEAVNDFPPRAEL